MQLEYYDILHAKMDSALEGEMEMVYKLIHTHTIPVSQLTNYTDTLVGSIVEKFAITLFVELPSTLIGKESKTGMSWLYMILILACVIVEKLDWLKEKQRMKSERLTTKHQHE